MKFLNSRSTLFVASLALSFGLVGCSELSEALKEEREKAKVKPSVDTKALVQADLSAMRDGASTLPTQDVRKYRLFSQMFGGESGRNVRAYVDERIRYYFDESDLDGADLSPRPRNTKYSENPNSRGPAMMLRDESEAVTAASNLGAGLFLQGAVDSNVITLVVPRIGQNIRIDSTRAGIMLFGPGYTQTARTEDGRTLELPTEYRQATLVHEARHSDCTGGVRQADLNVARNSRNVLEFVNNYPAMNCGHLHTMCPAWHEFKNLPACDRHFWGAYSVGYVFAAAKQNPSSTSVRDLLLRYMENDSASRLLYITNGPAHVVDVEPLLNGQFGYPDMTSSGVLD
jgi:hypothetical protein